jgi:uncharacterized membrane protein YvlD (DUF360 family)
MDAIKYAVRWFLRFVVVWLVDAISLLITSVIVPGVSFDVSTTGSLLVTAAAAAFLLGLVNLLIRPFILLLTLPFGFFVTFGVGFIVNAVVLLITSRLMPALQIDGFFAAFIGGLVLAAVNTIITGVITVDDDDSFYAGVVMRLAKRQTFRGAAEPGRGLAMMEIDGLSYWHMKHALDAGMLPTLKKMIDEEGYQLSRIDCGLPSQTSACQAGIMFGDNDDIPAFRWFDKDRQKLLVSGSDATEINARYALGNGLMRGGSSINNMMNGDAEKSLLTLADLRGGTPDEKQRRARDIYLLAANPYFLMRTIVLMLGDAMLEIYQYLKARSKGVEPRLDRLHHFYPMIRAATTVFMRDVAAYLMTLDIVRGAPSIYVTWPGYDEVAHHSGPWSSDAFGVLKKYDRVIRHIRGIIQEKAPRQYDLILLSDHGQSFGATFKQRYGLSLKEFIEQNLPQGMTVSQNMGGDTGIISLQAVSGELDNVQTQGVSGRVGGAVVKQGQKAAQRAVEERDEMGAAAAQVVAYGSGNLAQVYFDLYPRRILISELNAAYPNVVNALVQHEAIGLVSGYEDANTPVVLSKTGKRNLVTGEVTGEDPLKPYGDVALRNWQVRRVMDFPHAGDLMVISRVYPDGTVAALEELIGSHGGMGGEQTDAFMFHPADMQVGETRNSIDVFHILNARRGLPDVDKPVTPVAASTEVRAWALANLTHGLFHQPSRWVGRALRSLVFDRSAYQEVAKDAYMTGPALLLVVIGLAISAIMQGEALGWLALPARIGGWLVGSLAIFGAARVLGGKASYTTTFRALGFASVTYLLGLLALIPPLAPVTRLVVTIASFVAAWIGVAQAQELGGWRSLILPIAYILVFWISIAVLGVLLTGAALTLTTLAQELGLSPQ